MANDIKKLLELRKRMKARQPTFLRKDVLKKALGEKWRMPKGKTNKMRRCLRGHRKLVSSGYRAPIAVRDMSPTGLKIIRIASSKAVEKVDPKTECLLILNIGDKNRKNILLEAQKRKITITNVKDIPAEIARIDSEFENRKKEKKGRQEQKTLTKQDLKKKAEQKEKETKAASKTSDTDEEKKKEERLEAEKVMISK
ncbi:MAG TPA: eL32 family ribosomal protein [Candidatus Nanoarchaeia archaeon]|nr:eL32 family ribosomal protein [Candidatus Nanoarchaeia archaeon]